LRKSQAISQGLDDSSVFLSFFMLNVYFLNHNIAQ